MVGEDGAKWGSGEKTAYRIKGKSWVNNHAHILKCDAILLDVEFKKPGLLNFYGKLGFMRAENHIIKY